MTQALVNNFAAGSSLQDFDLSRNKSLRKLELQASSIDGSPGITSFLKHLLSTITSSAFLTIYLFHGEYYFRGITFGRSDWPQLSNAERENEVSRYHRRFEVLREMHKVRTFQLKLGVTAWGRFGEGPVRLLEEAIAEERAEGGFDEFPCKPSVV